MTVAPSLGSFVNSGQMIRRSWLPQSGVIRAVVVGRPAAHYQTEAEYEKQTHALVGLSGCGTLLRSGRASYRRLLLLLRVPPVLVTRREINHVANSPECPNHPGHSRRDCPFQGAHGPAGPALRVSTETIRKWRKRGVEDCLDHSARPHQLPWKATEEERAVVCALRRITNFALDDLPFVITHFLPHLNGDSIWRILKAEGLNRRPTSVSSRSVKGTGTFKEYDLGFIHIDI